MAECGWLPSPSLVVKCFELYKLRLILYVCIYVILNDWLNTKLWYKQTSDLAFTAN